MNTEIVQLSQIRVNDANPRTITDAKFHKLVNSILSFPKMLNIRPIAVDAFGVALGGNMRYRALVFIAGLTPLDIRSRLVDVSGFKEKTQGEKDLLVEYWTKWLDNPTAEIIRASNLSDAEQREFILKDNTSFGEWDYDELSSNWSETELDDWGVDVWQTKDEGDSSNDNINSGAANGSLSDRFIVPPFSVLDTRQGYWQTRKRMWREIIGDMGESRNDLLLKSPELKFKDLYERTREHRTSLGLSFREYLEKHVSDEVKEHEASKVISAGVSILDPVMAEIVCHWFGLEGGKTFDCFAGDSVFGYVSAKLGHEFTGIELREEQARLNNERIDGMNAKYICDDGQNVAQHIAPESQDLLFSCPPYFDLEVYSDLDNDANNQETYEDFLVILKNAFKSALYCLKQDRFAVIVIGDVRDKKTGFYYNFIDDMKHIFKDFGAALYNELILIETGASTALRASRYMDTRKVAKMHQNILVFYKGNPKNIKTNFKKIEYASEDLEPFGVDSGDESGGD